MRNAAIGLLIALLLSGCASASKTYAPDGREAFAINCSGLARNWGMCYEKAGELCGTRGYDVIGQGGDHGVAVSAGQAGGFGGSVISRSLLVACNLSASGSPSRSDPAGSSGTLSGTFSGEIRGVAYGNAFTMRVTFTLVQNGDEVAGVWNTSGGTSGTVSGIVRNKILSEFRAKQLNPCEGEFTGRAAIEDNSLGLRGRYEGRDCSGSVEAAFTVNRRD